jgi:hypothetical protein
MLFGEIIADDVPVRSGPGKEYGVVGTLGPEDTLKVLGIEGEWYRAQSERFDSDVWIYEKFVKEVPALSPTPTTTSTPMPVSLTATQPPPPTQTPTRLSPIHTPSLTPARVLTITPPATPTSTSLLPAATLPPTPTATSTSIPSPTYTPTPILTLTPTLPPTSTPMATVILPQIYQSPALLEPDDNKVLGFDRQQLVNLVWFLGEPLADDHWYEVQLWREGDEPTGRYWTKENWWDMGQEYYPGDYYWRVMVVQGKENSVVGAVSPSSEARFFQWIPVAPTPTLPPPSPPTPTPRPATPGP